MRTSFFLIAAVVAAVGIGCSADGVSAGNPSSARDMAFVFFGDDGGLPRADAAVGPCEESDPLCQHFALGPDYKKPFPLPTDPQPDPNAAGKGVARDPNGWLQLDVAEGALYFAWLAQTVDDTVAKLDTRTMKEVARYRTVTCRSRPTGSNVACDGESGCCAADSGPEWQNRRSKMPDGPAQQVQLTNNSPSRTAVDANGDLFVANRAFSGQASVTKIANALSRCKDRNKNGRIDTSSDVNKDGRIDPKDPKEFLDLDDECVLWTTNHGVPGRIGRPLALGPGTVPDGPADAFAGDYNDGIFYRIDGTTGKMKDQWQLPAACIPYGLAIDAQGFGWAVNHGCCSLCYFDTRKSGAVGTARGMMDGYGITLDRDQNIWVGQGVARYTPDRSKGFASLGSGYWTRIEGLSGIGIAADSRNDKKFFVWSAGYNGILRIPASDIPLPKGMDTSVKSDWTWPKIDVQAYGIGVDVDQNVIAAPQSRVVTRIKVDQNGDFVRPDVNSPPKNGELCPAGDRCDLGSYPYTYSDFTGFGLRNFTLPTGTWSYVIRGCVDPAMSTHWFAVTWNADVPPNTKISMRARSGPDSQPDGNWGLWTTSFDVSPVDLSLPGAIVPNGPADADARYLQVEFTLKTADGKLTPALKSLDVAYRCEGP